ncbi:MAG: SDR family NAD(P)-dependent oxidoreductase [Gammaproteobacteria bacterium]
MADETRRVALVTGANRGLGFEISRQLGAAGLCVVMAAREQGRAEAAAREVPGARPLRLDVRDTARIPVAVSEVVESVGRIDVLVNNAGVMLDGPEGIDAVPAEIVSGSLATNVMGPLLLTQAVLPTMRRQDYGRVVNMSSTLGAFHDITNPDSDYAVVDSPAYRLSKGALNLLTVLFARQLAGTNVLVNSACPGWVRTDMGSDEAPLSVEEGADTPVWLATLPDGGPSGGFFRQRQQIEW